MTERPSENRDVENHRRDMQNDRFQILAFLAAVVIGAGLLLSLIF